MESTLRSMRRALTRSPEPIYIPQIAIYITNQEAEDLARELAAMTGETITDAVIAALRDRREKLRAPSRAEHLARLQAITKRTAAAIGDRAITFDELYDDSGAPR